jgi:hypothetical protein
LERQREGERERDLSMDVPNHTKPILADQVEIVSEQDTLWQQKAGAVIN